jgi:hypothetical protein
MVLTSEQQIWCWRVTVMVLQYQFLYHSTLHRYEQISCVSVTVV